MLPILVAVALLSGCGNNAEIAWELEACNASISGLQDTATMLATQLDKCENDCEEMSWMLKEQLANTGVVEETGAIEEVEEIENKTPIFPPQPQVPAGDYTSRTEQLNAYAHNNMRTVKLPENATKMVVYLKEDIVKDGVNLIVYVNPKGVSRHCWARIEHNIKGLVLVYDLKSMDVQGTSCDGDWTEKFWNATEIVVGGFISTYDGNQIKYIEFE